MIESDSADAVAAIHVVEHFYYWEVEPLLTEWKRILKPGGKMILELPSGDKVFGYIAKSILANEPMQPFMTLLPLYGDPKHEDPLMCHKFLWFKKTLHEKLEKLGFASIEWEDCRYHFKFRDMRVVCTK